VLQGKRVRWPAQSHRRGRQPVIGLLFNGLTSFSDQNLWSGVVDAARERGANTVAFARGDYPADPANKREAIYDLVGPQAVDGLVVACTLPPCFAGAEETAALLDRYRALPLVSYGAIDDQVPRAVIDNYQGMRDAVDHLIEVHGCRRLAIAGGAHPYDRRERYRAYLDALEAHGLPFDRELVIPEGLPTSQVGQVVVRRLAAEGDAPIDAVVATDDLAAVAIMQACQAAGVRIPEDVAIVGFNDWLVSRVVAPSLTTVMLRAYDRGRQAADMLLSMVRGEPTPAEVVLPTRLVVRESCGCSLQGRGAQAADSWMVGKGDYGAALNAVRDRVLADMAHSVPDPAAFPTLAEQVLDAFLCDLAGEEGAFLRTVHRSIHQVTSQGHGLSVWRGMLAALQSYLLVMTEDEPGDVHSTTVCKARWLLMQAQLVTAEAAQRQEAYLRWQAQQQAAALHETGQVLSTALSIEALMDDLARELPRLGIPGCYVVLYEDPEPPTEWARLVLAYEEQDRIDLAQGGRRFRSSALLPDGLLDPTITRDLLVEPLYFRTEQLGYAVFAIGPREPGLYEALRTQISSALKSASLMERNVELYQEAVEAREAAEVADRLKSRFLSTVSHELRTPLNLLVGLSEMMLQDGSCQDPLPPAYQQDLQRIYSSARHLDGLVRDVLDLASSQVGELRLIKHPVDLHEVLEMVAMAGATMARQKGLLWEDRIPPVLPPVWGDATRLRQVSLNLINNAIKFTDHGQVSLKAAAEDGRVIIRVRDTGVGMPPEAQDFIFDEFWQSEHTAVRGYGGLGLGLAICRRLIELHGGQIGVHSSGEEGAGSEFYFALPAMADSQNVRSTLSPCEQPVLIVTESSRDSEPLRAHLEAAGFLVDEMSVEGQEDWLSAILTAPPGAIVLGYEPASQKGWELLQALKRDPRTEDIPVLFYSLLWDRDSGTLLHADYVPKPSSEEAVARALAQKGLTGAQEDGRQSILIVDDDPETLHVQCRRVRSQFPDCRIMEAMDGKAALAQMLCEPPSVVLLDLMMPELDGFGVLEAMRGHPALREVPVVVLTGVALAAEDFSRLNQGVAAVLQKGVFSTAETLAQIEQALSNSKRLSSETQRVVRRAMAHIHSCYADRLTRSDLAAHVHVSERHLDRCFRHEIGVPPITYLNRYRIQRAKSLLEMEGSSILDVALAVGFSQASYFSRVFRRETGVSPSEYLDELQGGPSLEAL
jgi:signal transduction histidine kinase/DNA-binding LacI/PurR family transcriptional regulator/AraC-like DNA-binding protein